MLTDESDKSYFSKEVPFHTYVLLSTRLTITASLAGTALLACIMGKFCYSSNMSDILLSDSGLAGIHGLLEFGAHYSKSFCLRKL